MEIISEQIVELPLDKQIEKSKKIIFERKLRKPDDGKELIEMKDVTEESAIIVDEEIIESTAAATKPRMVRDDDDISMVEKPKKLIIKKFIRFIHSLSSCRSKKKVVKKKPNERFSYQKKN